MLNKPAIRHFFAGSHTAYGYHSLYNNILNYRGRRFIILKGGPGTGKSTLLKKVGAGLLDKGYDMDYFHCSSDTVSLDGIASPALKVGVIDGTAPHVIEPDFPGVYDEIINLGDFWDEKKLLPHRDVIISLGRDINETFKAAYSFLAEIKLSRDHLDRYTVHLLNTRKINRITCEVIDKVIAGETYNGLSRERHLFASAVTPEGVVNHYDSIFSKCSEFYLLKGSPGTGKSKLIGTVCQALHTRGLEMEVFRCPIDPEKIDAIVIPEKSAAVIKVTDFQPFNLSSHRILHREELSLNHFYPSRDQWTENLLKEFGSNFNNLLKKAVSCLERAKRLHKEREAYYMAAMDFSRVDETADKILNKFLSM